MSTNSALLKKVEIASVEEIINALHEAHFPIKSAAVIRDMEAAEFSGSYKDETAEEGYTYDGLELAAPTPGRGITYILLGVGGLESGFAPGVTLVKWEGQ